MSALVCWSGGLDSTAALLHAAADASKQVPVAAVSFNHRQIAAAPRERAARARILAWMRRKGYTIWHSEVDIKWRGQVPLDPSAPPETDATGKGQPSVLHPFYVGLAVPYMRKADDLVLGYIKWDPIWHWREWLYGAFGNLAVLAGVEGKLRLPLEWWEKKDVLENLEKWKFPFDLCWSCQEPKGRRSCGACDSCTERREAERSLARRPRAGGGRV